MSYIDIPTTKAIRSAIMLALRTDKLLRWGGWTMKVEEEPVSTIPGCGPVASYIVREEGQFRHRFRTAGTAADYLMGEWQGAQVQVLDAP